MSNEANWATVGPSRHGLCAQARAHTHSLADDLLVEVVRTDSVTNTLWVRAIQQRTTVLPTSRLPRITSPIPSIVQSREQKKRKGKKNRCEQDSNLRGKIPLDFESNALTTRPSQRWQPLRITYIWTLLCTGSLNSDKLHGNWSGWVNNLLKNIFSLCLQRFDHDPRQR